MLKRCLKRALSLIISIVIVTNIVAVVQADSPNCAQVEEGLYIIKSLADPNKVLSVNGGEESDKDDAALKIWDFTNKTNQIFYFSYDPKDKSYEIIPINSLKCVGVDGYKSGIGAQVKQNPFSFRDYNKWRVQNTGAGAFEFTLKSNGLSLNVKGGSVQTGANLDLGFKNGTVGQKFKLQKVLFKNPADKDRIINMINDKKNQQGWDYVNILPPQSKIYRHTFDLFENVKYIKIPTSVTEIEDGAFDDLEKLEQVECDPKWLCKFNKNKLRTIIVPPEIKDIPPECFKGLKNVRQILFSSGIKSIGEGAFEGCENLSEIKLAMSVSSKKCGNVIKIVPTIAINKIPARAFKNCKKLANMFIPPTVTEVDKTAFEGCESLDASNIVCSDEIKKLFTKVFKVETVDGEIRPEDYEAYINAQLLEIPLNTKINHPEFLKQCKNLRFIQCEPNLLKYLDKSSIKAIFISNGVEDIPIGAFDDFNNLEMVEIPETVEDLPDNIFQKCEKINTVICPSRLLRFFDRKKLKNVVINENVDPSQIDPNCFFDCQNVENISIPWDFSKVGQIIIPNCPRLTSIRDRLHDHMDFNQSLNVDDQTVEIVAKNCGEFKNMVSMDIATSVQFIEKSVFSQCHRLSYVKADPKLLKYLPKSNITTVVVPKGVKTISEADFDGCINLTNVIIEDENTRFCGKSCNELENVSQIKCFPNTLMSVGNSLRNRLKNIEISDGCRTIPKATFSNFSSLQNVNFPKSLEKIEQRAFYNCPNLGKVVIPDSVKSVELDAFFDCKNLIKVSCKADLLKNLPKKQLQIVKISDATEAIASDDLNGLENLEKLEIPKKITKLPKDIFKNCKKPSKIACSSELLAHLKQQHKLEFREVELDKDDDGSKISEDKKATEKAKENETVKINKDVKTAEDVKINGPAKGEQNAEKNCNEMRNEINEIEPAKQQPKPKPPTPKKQTTVDDLVLADGANAKYAGAIKIVLEDLISGKNRSSGPSGSIGDLSRKLTEICQAIRNKYNMTPHPVQCLTILRIADQLLNSKGAVAEVKTGEGKSFIIAVLAILLTKYGKTIDIVTSTTELASRDEREQRQYYQMFGVSSGVLYNKTGDKDFLNIQTIQPGQDAAKQFNTEVFGNQVVYSTNSNLEFVYLHSLFGKGQLRNRPYDIVIVDEVDNMLMDQSSSPAILARGYPIMYLEDVLKIVYIMQNCSDDDILDMLRGYFPKIGNFDPKMIRMMKKAAQTANKYSLGEQYVIEDNKIVIIDQFTGYKKPGSRWQNYIHEMVEIKERVPVQSSQISFSAISQHMFFNQYSHISGLTGTVGTEQDIAFLNLAYGVGIFKVPRNIVSQQLTFCKNRPGDLESLFKMLYFDIMTEVRKGRPVLVIMDSVKKVEKFLEFLANNSKTPINCGKIEGINAQQDRAAIELAGKSGRITIATQAAGRGTNIKLDNVSLLAGGLHVIIPFPMPNRRVLEQAIGRSARQGQPGSAMVYMPCICGGAEPVKPGYANLVVLQRRFAKYVKDHWPWIYDHDLKYATDVQYPFGVTVEEMLEISAKGISKIEKPSEQQLSNFFRNMIITAWGMFFHNMQENVDEYADLGRCESEYNHLIKALNVWVGAKCKTLLDQRQHFELELFSRIDWVDVAVKGALIVAGGAAIAVFAPATSGMMIAGAILTGAALGCVNEVYEQLKRGEEVNWGVVIARTLGGGAKAAILCIPGVGAFTLGTSIGAVGTLENFACNALEGDCTPKALMDSAIGGGIEGLSVGALSYVGNKLRSKIPAGAKNLAKVEEIPDKPLSEAELEKIFGGSKNAIDKGLVKRYIQDIEAKTNFKLPRNQIDEIKNALRSKEYHRLDPTRVSRHRGEFARVKNKCISEWEKNTGQKWPTYKEPVYKRSGSIARKVGDKYDAHHIIEVKYGGDNSWWNITPAKFPDEHQQGIHATKGPARKLFK